MLLNKDYFGEVSFYYNDHVFDKFDWGIPVDISLDRLYTFRAQQLRDKYKKLILSFSGGTDSIQVLNTFLKNRIHLDEIVVAHHTELLKNVDLISAEHARFVQRLNRLANGLEADYALQTDIAMKTSARNALRGVITDIKADTLSAEVAVAVSPETTIYSLLTAESVRGLGLVVGREAIVLIQQRCRITAQMSENRPLGPRFGLGGIDRIDPVEGRRRLGVGFRVDQRFGAQQQRRHVGQAEHADHQAPLQLGAALQEARRVTVQGADHRQGDECIDRDEDGEQVEQPTAGQHELQRQDGEEQRSVHARREQDGQRQGSMDGNVQEAARGTQQVSANISDVQRGATETGSASAQVLSAAQSLSQDSNKLKVEVAKFLDTVRAA